MINRHHSFSNPNAKMESNRNKIKEYNPLIILILIAVIIAQIIEMPKGSIPKMMQQLHSFIFNVEEQTNFPNKRTAAQIAADIAQQERIREEQIAQTNQYKHDGDEELHVVGVYQTPLHSEALGHLRSGDTNIVVDRPGKKIILILSSIKALKWNVTTTKDTQIKDIILSSRENKRSRVLLNGEPFDVADITINSAVYQTKGKYFAEFKDEVKATIGLEISSFSGSYYAQKQYVINAVSDDAKLKVNYLKTDYPGDFATKITPNTFDYKYHGIVRGKKVSNFNVMGKNIKVVPQDIQLPATFKTLSKAEKDKPVQGEYYSITIDSIKKYNSEGVLLEEILLDVNLPRFQRTKGITYDETNDRIVILTSHIFNYLYFYDLKSKKWSITGLGKSVSNKDNYVFGFGVRRSFTDIAFDKHNNNYVVLSDLTSDLGILLSTFSQEGTLINTESIPSESFTGLTDLYYLHGTIYPKIRIAQVTPDEVIITASDYRSSMDQIYVYNRKIKKLYLAWFLER